MTPSRGAANFADSVVGGRWRIALLFPLLLCATHGFLLAPPPPSAAGGFSSTGSGSDLGRAAGAGQQCSCRPLARRTASTYTQPTCARAPTAQGGGVCLNMASDDSSSKSEAEGDSSKEEGEKVTGKEQKPFFAGDMGTENADDAAADETEEGANGAEEVGEGGEEEAERKLPELLNPTREELQRAFPNAPKAPYPTLPDVRKLTPEQLAAGDNIPVSYGGTPGAKRANIDFERSERERIHLQTAARVMNYQIQAERAEIMEGKSSAAPRQERTDELPGEFEEADFPDDGIDAVYTWDQQPQLITFTGYGVLYNWHLPIGLIMREALGRSNNYVHRMPGPSFFEKHFKKSYKEASWHMPCFGIKNNISSWEWWFHVFTDAYIKTLNEFDMDEEILADVLDDLVDELYYQVMVGPEAFECVPYVKVVLDRLAAWRDTNGGPKLAVVSNDDERLHTVLENLGLLPYFDFVLTSRETGVEYPEPKIFEMALETADVKIARKGLHIGCDYASDITASCEAGMEACCVKPQQSEVEREGEPYEYHRLIQIEELLNRMGLPEVEKEYLSRRRGMFWEEGDEDDDDDEDFEP